MIHESYGSFLDRQIDIAKKEAAGPRPLILASASPRRQELLKLCGIPFTVATADIDETELEMDVRIRHHDAPLHRMTRHIVKGLALKKAQTVIAANRGAVVIGSDTVVTCGMEILGKPANEEDAFRMLKRLSGRTHKVVTGVAILSNTGREVFHTETRVTFHDWKDGGEELARRYIATGSPMDKAGAYGIQDMGALFVKEIKGDYYTVMGFPIAEVYRRLQAYYPSLRAAPEPLEGQGTGAAASDDAARNE